MISEMAHPMGTRARVLLSAVFKPFAQDDEYGSRRVNPMALYHNQVTREQGPFSLRMFHRSWGGMEHYLRASNPIIAGRIRRLRVDVEREFGLGSRLVNRSLGPLLLWASRWEARRHPEGPRLEPATFVDRRLALQT